MNSKGKITQEDVWKACETVFAEGKPVTNEKVRAVLKRGSYSTISEHVKSWKERPDSEVSVKDYPMSDWVKKAYEEMNQVHWNTFVGRYELIIDNEKIVELEKENESLRDKLELAQDAFIRLEESEKYRKEQSEQIDKLTRQQRLDAAEIQRLTGIIDKFH